VTPEGDMTRISSPCKIGKFREEDWDPRKGKGPECGCLGPDRSRKKSLSRRIASGSKGKKEFERSETKRMKGGASKDRKGKDDLKRLFLPKRSGR